MDLLPRSEGAQARVGLTTAEVLARTEQGHTNAPPPGTARTPGQILRANLLTPFNLLLGTLAVAVVLTGAWRDALFGIVIIANALVGIVQELRAKRALDRLAVLNAPTARAVRDGKVSTIPSDAVVIDDLLEVEAGDQVVADAVVLRVEGLEVDESLLTGESQAVPKRPGDRLLSDSIVTAGAARCQVTAVGASSFAGRITSDARRFTTTSSELVDGINRILAAVAIAIAVAGPMLFITQRQSAATWREALHASVAALVGIVPEGLVLLTSAAFFAAALGLARHRVLVRDLPAVEGLARVDVLCVDKTGTLTSGEIAFNGLEILSGGSRPEVEAAVAAIAAVGPPNATARSLRRAFPSPPGWVCTNSVPFSSTRRWSAASFTDHGTWVLGAPDVVVRERTNALSAELVEEGYRTLLLATTASPVVATALPPELQPVALLVFEENLREDAADTMRYFGDQRVAIKVMSGDDPRTAAAVARRAGIGADAGVDARQLLECGPEQMAPAVESHAVFGRVAPEQKRTLVASLQAQGHVVAMTGDGVNDVLALKQADIGIAMGSGAAATRSVAQLVLLGNKFAVMPQVVAEGRRVIANIERVAALFLTKNVTSLILSVTVALAGWPYPFLPRHGTLVSTLAIGLPGFVLALGPKPHRFEPGFVRRVLAFSAPAGAVISAAVASGYGLTRADGLTLEEARTAATIVLLIASLWVLVIQARPLRRWKAGLVVAMAGLGALAFAVPWARAFFALRLPGAVPAGRSVVLGLAAAGAIELVSRQRTRGGRSRPAAPAQDGAEKAVDGGKAALAVRPGAPAQAA